ncbi:MAG: hypothetical protein Q8L00_06045 [Deltaproteobacteria bacterium]|nr:hypothetical protein [Deltaproteobacteria bacterium]
MPPECLAPGIIPPGMLRNNREADQDFAPEENLFIRFREFCDDEPIPIEIKSVNQSLNRSKHSCQPEWILLPSYHNQGYGVLKRSDVPPFKLSQGGVRYDFHVEHVPEDFNYCHSEIHAYKSGRLTDKIKGNIEMKTEFRMEIFEKIEVLKFPDN